MHLWGGISRSGLTPLVIFEGKLESMGFQQIITRGLLPFINEKFPDGHRFFQDGDPKHTSHSTLRFMAQRGINIFHSPADSPDLNPIEMLFNTNN